MNEEQVMAFLPCVNTYRTVIQTLWLDQKYSRMMSSGCGDRYARLNSVQTRLCLAGLDSLVLRGHN